MFCSSLFPNVPSKQQRRSWHRRRSVDQHQTILSPLWTFSIILHSGKLLQSLSRSRRGEEAHVGRNVTCHHEGNIRGCFGWLFLGLFGSVCRSCVTFSRLRFSDTHTRRFEVLLHAAESSGVTNTEGGSTTTHIRTGRQSVVPSRAFLNPLKLSNQRSMGDTERWLSSRSLRFLTFCLEFWDRSSGMCLWKQSQGVSVRSTPKTHKCNTSMSVKVLIRVWRWGIQVWTWNLLSSSNWLFHGLISDQWSADR